MVPHHNSDQPRLPQDLTLNMYNHLTNTISTSSTVHLIENIELNIMHKCSSSTFIPVIAPRTIVVKNTPLAADFRPGSYDIVCSRGKAAFNHIGNRRFRFMISNHVEKYSTCKSKVDKSLVVIDMVAMIRELSPTGGFVRFCKKTNRFVDVGDSVAREKVGQHCEKH